MENVTGDVPSCHTMASAVSAAAEIVESIRILVFNDVMVDKWFI